AVFRRSRWRTPLMSAATRTPENSAEQSIPKPIKSARMRIANPTLLLNAGQSFTAGLAGWTVWAQAQRAAARMGSNGNVQIGGWQNACALFRPFHQTQAVVIEIVTDTHVFKLFRVAQAVQVEVIDLNVADPVGLDQCKGRAFHRANMPQPLQD